MGQVFGQDIIAPVVKASSTSLTMAATSGGQPVRITVGGQQYSPASTITLNTGTSGFNGIDTGSFTASTIYNIFAVISSGTLGTVISASTSPTGFTSYKFLGKLVAATGATISHVMNVGEPLKEYVYNTAGTTAAGGTNSTSFGYGVGGAAIGSINSTTTTGNSITTMVCRFLNPILSTDFIEVELSTDGAVWQNASAIDTSYTSVQGTAEYGLGYRIVNGSTTDINIQFGNAGRRSTGGAYSSSGSTWAGISGWTWRAVKVSTPITTP